MTPATPESVIADHPPRDGRNWDCQCARCGSSCEYQRCHEWDCQDGYVVECDQFHEDETVQTTKCYTCNGYGGWNVCLSSPEWCAANPLDGRENVKRGQIEWFVVRDEHA